MTEQEQRVLEYLRQQYSEHSKFYSFVGINIDLAYNGCARQSLFVELDKHSNLHSHLHGGVFMTIGDSCMGAACASLGKRVVTLDTHINFIANIELPAKITCEAKVIHNGRKTIVMGAEVLDGDGRVLSRLRSTYYVIGTFEEIAAQLP